METLNSAHGEVENRSLSFDGAISLAGAPNTCGQFPPIGEMDGAQLFGAPVTVAGDFVVEGKRKRGRPPRGQGKPPPAKKQKEEEEDVCFICFDGGSLVLCDRRACPKAYHPACIKRDEAFFRSKARWNCGWHICSVCQKASHYMCYTCTYSLCKACTKDSDYLSVRGDKGFCNTCMITVMLIENKEQGNQEMVHVDFDDKSSWEYLFKVYWIYLKEKLCLTLAELNQAKNPWKESNKMIFNGQTPVSCMNYVKSSKVESTFGQQEGSSCTQIKSNESVKTVRPVKHKDIYKTGCSDWATKELLDFVAHMKDGDTSVMSQFDVQALLLDYIKKNNLRDPRNKSHIFCDIRLRNLFDKPRVGHFEMLKLLEFHFLIKEEQPKDVFVQGGILDVNTIQVLADENNDNLMGKDRKRRARKKGEEPAPQTNLNEFAAIDVHNIQLIYLRRNLMENLIEEKEKFHDNVVGSVVRIRISGGEPKQDMYRLVQVIGTTKASVPYKLSNRTENVMLEVLNLDKKEAVSIDAISNQDFSEEECRRLRQSIKCGLVKRFTVGEIQGKAMALQVVRLNDWLESEILRLNHLRDRASENGRKKELRECVEKLQLLKTPEERQRRLRKIPVVHSDPNMDPNYESDEGTGKLDNKKQGENVKSRYTGYNREGSKPVPLRKKTEVSGDTGSRAWNNSNPTYDRNKNMCSASYLNKEESAAEALQKLRDGKDASRSNILPRPGNEADCTGLGIGNWNNQAATSSSFSPIASETSVTPLPMGNAGSVYNSETKLWHYRDPNGKIQGPFCMVQLQKWSTTGYFPRDLRIWAVDRQDDSILLNDAVKGQFHKLLPLLNDISLKLREVEGVADGKLYNSGVGWGENVHVTRDVQTEGQRHCNIATGHSSIKNELVNDRCGSQSSVLTSPVVSYKKDIPAGSCSQEQILFNGNSSSHNQLLAHSPLSSSTISGTENASFSHHGKSAQAKTKISDSDNENWSSHGTAIQGSSGCVLENHSNNRGVSGQSSRETRKHSPINFSENNLNLNSTKDRSNDSADQHGQVNITNLHTPSRKIVEGNWENEAAENKESISSSVHVQELDVQDLPSPTPSRSEDYQKLQAAENQQFVSLYIPVQDSGCWSGSSNLVVHKAQLADITDEWGGYSPTPGKSSVEDWESTFSVSAMKPSGLFCEPIEFSTLAEESVSDLLAEVDAMESQCGFASPTSAMNCETTAHEPRVAVAISRSPMSVKVGQTAKEELL